MASPSGESQIPDSLKNRKFKSIAKSRLAEKLVTTVLGFCALVSVATTVGIVYVLITESAGFFLSDNVSMSEYLTPGD